MSKRSEEFAKRYSEEFILTVDHKGDVYEACIDAYHQAEKDVWDRIEKYLSNRNPTDYATVVWILKNIEEYKKKIMEEEKC